MVFLRHVWQVGWCLVFHHKSYPCVYSVGELISLTKRLLIFDHCTNCNSEINCWFLIFQRHIYHTYLQRTSSEIYVYHTEMREDGLIGKTSSNFHCLLLFESTKLDLTCKECECFQSRHPLLSMARLSVLRHDTVLSREHPVYITW